MTDDPYEILGVGRDATPEQINAAYRAKARAAHPDTGGSTDEFTRVKSASMVLLDPKMRERFDRTGKFEEVEPDNRQAKVMELIANFFVSSIEALDDPRAPSLEQLDLVEAATSHFTQQISGAEEHVRKLNFKIRNFEKALKRLKSKSANDVVRKMLERHLGLIKGLVLQTRDEQEIFKEVLAVLADYEFEPGQLTLTGTQQQNSRYNDIYGQGFFR